MENRGEIVIYQTKAGGTGIAVKLEDDTVWLTQKQMVELFKTTKQNVSLHIQNIFEERELNKISVVKDSLTTAPDGKQYRVSYYNLDVIISVGYRIKSMHGVRFRQWATGVLKQHIVGGYTINKDRLNNLENLCRYMKDTLTITSMNINRLRIDSARQKDIAVIVEEIDNIKMELDGIKKKLK